MTKKKTEELHAHVLDVMPRARLEIFAQVVLITLASIAVFAAIGYFLDHQFGTYPVIFVVSVFVSFPFTQFFLLRRVHRIGKERLKQTKQ